MLFKMKKRFFTLFILMTAFTYGQSKGKIFGLVKDKSNALEPLPWVKITVERSRSIKSRSDKNGVFEIELLAGKQTIVFKKTGYKTIKKVVKIKENESVEINITMETLGYAFDTFETNTKNTNTVSEQEITYQEKVITIADTISKPYIDLVNARYVYRLTNTFTATNTYGISNQLMVNAAVDRNNLSQINNLDFKGINPNSNAVATEFFPEEILGNTTITKYPLANQSANFSGGLVNTTLKPYVGAFFVKARIGLGYNPSMHFNSNYLNYTGTATDRFGFDNGDRDLPIQNTVVIPTGGQTLTDLTNNFNSELAAKQATSLLNYNLGVTLGGATKNSVNKLGYLVNLSYKNQTSFYESINNGIYAKELLFFTDPNSLSAQRTSIGNFGVSETSLSALLNLSYNVMNSDYGLHIMHIQNGVSKAGLFNQNIIGNGITTTDTNLFKDALTYTQSGLTQILLSGTHHNDAKNWKISWQIAPSLNKVLDKDHRVTPLAFDGFNYEIDANEYPVRIWRTTEEVNLDNSLGFVNTHTLFQHKSRLKFGGAYTLKNRNFNIDDYFFETTLTSIANGDADEFLEKNNIWNPNTNQGTFVSDQNSFEAYNNFESSYSTLAGYALENLHFSDRFNITLGARFEKFTANYTGEDNVGNSYTNQNILTTSDIFPSAQLSYEYKRLKFFNLNYSKTVNRPTMQELNTAQVYNPITTLTYLGNINIQPSYFNNISTALEWYATNGGYFKLSGFYKQITDVVELAFDETVNGVGVVLVADKLQHQNTETEKATVFGFGLDFKKNFSGALSGLSFYADGVINFSSLKMSGSEFNSRVSYELSGETTSETREIQGQAPYQVSGGLSFEKDDFNIGLAYSMQGKTLQIVGNGPIADVYTQPFHALNFSVSKAFVSNEHMHQISFKADNLLNDTKESFYESFGLASQIFSAIAPGRQLSATYSFSF